MSARIKQLLVIEERHLDSLRADRRAVIDGIAFSQKRVAGYDQTERELLDSIARLKTLTEVADGGSTDLSFD